VNFAVQVQSLGVHDENAKAAIATTDKTNNFFILLNFKLNN
jgi:hypothetical protein